MAERSRYFYEEVACPDDLLAHLHASLVAPLQDVIAQLSTLAVWNKESIHEVLNRVAEQHELKLGKLAQPIRIALTSSTVSPSIDTTIVLLGRDKTLSRLEKAMHIAAKH